MTLTEKQVLKTAYARLVDKGIDYYVDKYNEFFRYAKKSLFKAYLGLFLLYGPNIIEGNSRVNSIEKLKALEGAVIALILTDDLFDKKNYISHRNFSEPKINSVDDPNIFELIALKYKRNIGLEPFTVKELWNIIHNLSLSYDKEEYVFVNVEVEPNMVFRYTDKILEIPLSFKEKIEIKRCYEEELKQFTQEILKEEFSVLRDIFKEITAKIQKNTTQNPFEIIMQKLEHYYNYYTENEEKEDVEIDRIIAIIMRHFSEKKEYNKTLLVNELKKLATDPVYFGKIVVWYDPMYDELMREFSEKKDTELKNKIQKILKQLEKDFVFPVYNDSGRTTYRTVEIQKCTMEDFSKEAIYFSFDPEKKIIEIVEEIEPDEDMYYEEADYEYEKKTTIRDITGYPYEEQRKILLEYLKAKIKEEGKDSIIPTYKRPLILLLQDIEKGTHNFSNLELLSIITGLFEDKITNDRQKYIRQGYKSAIKKYNKTLKPKL